MLKKTIKFEDFDEVMREEDHYFHITKTELTKLNLRGDGGLKGIADSLTQARNISKVADLVEELIHLSYGIKSGDGRNFLKNEEIWNDFRSSNAYDVLYQELINDGTAVAKFVEGVIPKDMRDAVSKAIADEEKKTKTAPRKLNSGENA